MNFLMALIALSGLGIFLGILIWHVPSPDLVAVALFVFALAAYDFVTSATKKKKD